MSTHQQIKVFAIAALLCLAWIVGSHLFHRANPMDATAGIIPWKAEPRVTRMLRQHGILSDLAETTGPCILQVNHTRLSEARKLIVEDGRKFGYVLKTPHDPFEYWNAVQSVRH